MLKQHNYRYFQSKITLAYIFIFLIIADLNDTLEVPSLTVVPINFEFHDSIEDIDNVIYANHNNASSEIVGGFFFDTIDFENNIFQWTVSSFQPRSAYT